MHHTSVTINNIFGIYIIDGAYIYLATGICTTLCTFRHRDMSWKSLESGTLAATKLKFKKLKIRTHISFLLQTTKYDFPYLWCQVEVHILLFYIIISEFFMVRNQRGTLGNCSMMQKRRCDYTAGESTAYSSVPFEPREIEKGHFFYSSLPFFLSVQSVQNLSYERSDFKSIELIYRCSWYILHCAPSCSAVGLEYLTTLGQCGIKAAVY